jgi:hypothetical protein
MSRSTRDFFERELHWDNFSRKLSMIIDELHAGTDPGNRGSIGMNQQVDENRQEISPWN